MFNMRCLCFLSCWFFFLCISSGAVAEAEQDDSASTLEVGMVFPRNESTINPSLFMPFVFSFQNTKLVPTLQPYFIYDVYNNSNTSQPVLRGRIGDENIDISANHDPHFEVNYHWQFNTEGKWLLTLVSGFYSCFEDPDRIYNNTYTIDTRWATVNITFTTKGPSRKVDLVAATDGKNCSSEAGLIVKVQDTVETPQGDRRSDEMESDICPLEPSATVADKCVAVVPSVASSIAAEISNRVCKWPWTPNRTEKPDGIECGSPKEEENMGAGNIFGWTTCVAFLIGALAYIL